MKEHNHLPHLYCDRQCPAFEFKPAFDMPITTNEAIAVIAAWGNPGTMTFGHSRAKKAAEILSAAFVPHGSYETSVAINAIMQDIHARNVMAGWWSNLETGEPLKRNVGEMIALMHSELSEALEGHRKNLMDDHLPHRPMIEVEFADTIIRIMDACGGLKLDLGGAMVEKLTYNAKREDHKREARMCATGKKI